MWNLLLIFAAFAAAIALYRFRHKILGALQRFDARNAERQREELQARFDEDAHFRETIRVADEQVETYNAFSASDERTGLPVTRYVFEGVTYESREEAEEMRASRIGDVTREFYRDLDSQRLGRSGRGTLN